MLLIIIFGDVSIAIIFLSHLRYVSKRLWAQWEDNSTHPSLPYSAVTPSKLAAWASFRNFTHFGREKHVRESLIHGVTTHNWFAHYLYDIYKGFGHNGKRIQRTLPSLPYSAVTLQIGCLGQFSKLHTLRKRNMCVKVSDTVLPPITGLRITFMTYTKALSTMGR